jgi:GAF domain-containing protein
MGSAEPGSPLVAAAHAVLRDTVVRRGNDPHPVRTPLPVQLPQQLAEQLAAAHQQQLAAQAAQAAEQAAATAPRQQPRRPVPTPANPLIAPAGGEENPPTAGQYRQPRRGADGSAMQQLRR